MKYRAFWLDTKTGASIELGRGVAVEVHIQYVLGDPETFGFTGQEADQLRAMLKGRVPYELSDYPGWLVRKLLSRWVKVRIDERYINFTTQDRPTRSQIEAMQDFVLEKRFRQGVFLMGEPSGKILGRFRQEDFLGVRHPGQLRRVAARRAVAWDDRMPGGIGDDKTPGDFEPEAVLEGMRVELEHTDDKHTAIEIALDHLTEDPGYYRKLREIEDHGEAEVHTPDVKLAKPRKRVFIEGDDLVAEIGSVADALFGRGAEGLGLAALNWVKSVVASQRSRRWQP